MSFEQEHKIVPKMAEIKRDLILISQKANMPNFGACDVAGLSAKWRRKD